MKLSLFYIKSLILIIIISLDSFSFSQISQTIEFYDNGNPKLVEFLNADLNLKKNIVKSPSGKIISEYNYDPSTGSRDSIFFDGNNSGKYEKGVLNSKNFTFYRSNYYSRDQKYIFENIINGRPNGKVECYSLTKNSDFQYDPNYSFLFNLSDPELIRYISYIDEEIYIEKLECILNYNENGNLDGEIQINRFHFLYYDDGKFVGYKKIDQNLGVISDSIFINNQIWKFKNRYFKNCGYLIGVHIKAEFNKPWEFYVENEFDYYNSKNVIIFKDTVLPSKRADFYGNDNTDDFFRYDDIIKIYDKNINLNSYGIYTKCDEITNDYSNNEDEVNVCQINDETYLGEMFDIIKKIEESDNPSINLYNTFSNYLKQVYNSPISEIYFGKNLVSLTNILKKSKFLRFNPETIKYLNKDFSKKIIFLKNQISSDNCFSEDYSQLMTCFNDLKTTKNNIDNFLDSLESIFIIPDSKILSYYREISGLPYYEQLYKNKLYRLNYFVKKDRKSEFQGNDARRNILSSLSNLELQSKSIYKWINKINNDYSLNLKISKTHEEIDLKIKNKIADENFFIGLRYERDLDFSNAYIYFKKSIENNDNQKYVSKEKYMREKILESQEDDFNNFITKNNIGLSYFSYENHNKGIISYLDKYCQLAQNINVTDSKKYNYENGYKSIFKYSLTDRYSSSLNESINTSFKKLDSTLISKEYLNIIKKEYIGTGIVFFLEFIKKPKESFVYSRDDMEIIYKNYKKSKAPIIVCFNFIPNKAYMFPFGLSKKTKDLEETKISDLKYITLDENRINSVLNFIDNRFWKN